MGFVNRFVRPENTEADTSVGPSGISRRELLCAAGVASGWIVLRPLVSLAQTAEQGLTPAQQGVDASDEFAAPNWKPVFFSAEQDLTLVALCDVMIPATETPGAKQALVDRYIDLVLAAESPDVQQAFLKSLQHVDDESTRLYGKPFRSVSTEERIDLLMPMAYPMQPGLTSIDVPRDSGYENFMRLKSMIVEGYYSSEMGTQELGWDGAYAHGRFAGCPAEKHD